MFVVASLKLGVYSLYWQDGIAQDASLTGLSSPSLCLSEGQVET